MITFEINRHIEKNENYQGFNLTEFTFIADDKIVNDQIIDTFLHSRHFTFDSLRNVEKHNAENKSYLRQAFDIDRIKISDFRKLDKSETAKFLFDVLNQLDWGDDKTEFAKLSDKYFEIHSQLKDRDFYVINKDWFDKDDKRVLEPENWIYSYYFLILYIDSNSKTLILTEWTYD
jgi:hypothetical protein